MSQNEGCAYLVPIHPDIIQDKEASTLIPSETTIIGSDKISLAAPVCYIGRDVQVCQILISNSRRDIRRVQARIIREDSTYILEDNSSPYGTFVDGKRISEPTPLRDQQKIGFGASKEMLVFNDPDMVHGTARQFHSVNSFSSGRISLFD